MFILLTLILSFTICYLKVEYDAKQLVKYSSEEVKKGAEFELDVVKRINELYPTAKVLQNLIIPKKKGGTTEIDVLVLTDKGFFVLECKNYNGFVVGKAKSKKWTIFYYKKYKKTFYSPIVQNRGHVFALRDMFPKYFFSNIVIFSDSSKLAKDIFNAKEVKSFKGFSWFLENTLTKKKAIYTQAEVDAVYNYLAPFVNGDRNAHIEYVKKVQQRECV